VTPGFVSRVLSGDENISVRKMAEMFHKLGREYVQSVRQEVVPFQSDVVSSEMPIASSKRKRRQEAEQETHAMIAD